MKTSTKWIIGILIVAFIVLPSIWGIIYYMTAKKELKAAAEKNTATGTERKFQRVGMPPPPESSKLTNEGYCSK
jgi:di/tricarboxylate transporter